MTVEHLKNNKTSPPDEALYAIAERQEGLFTAQQAKGVGFDPRNHNYYLKTGSWIKEERGIFRLKNFPYSEDSELVKWSLWSRNKMGEPQGVFSHYTALRIFDLSDTMPSKIHMIVPKNFRRRAFIPKILELHKEELSSDEIKIKRGFRVTTPLRTFYDLVHSNLELADSELLHQAIREALQAGLISKSELKQSKLWPSLEKIDWSPS